MRVYDKMENDPMLMLEQDDDFGLRLAKNASKKSKDVNKLERELLRERDEAKRSAFQQSSNPHQSSPVKKQHNFVNDYSRNDSKMEDLSNQHQSFSKENQGEPNDLEQLDKILEQLSFDL